MDVFAKIEGSVAITRHPKGILRQNELYARGKDVFIRLGSGFVRIVQEFDNKFLTVIPEITVLEFDAENVVVGKDGSVRFVVPNQKLKAA